MMRFGRVPTRSRWFRTWVVVAAAGLVGAIILSTSPGTPSPSASPSARPGASGAAGASIPAGPSGAASPSADSGAWQPVALAPYIPIADMVATSSDAAGVETDTAFRLTSRTGATAASLAERLEVVPAIALTVASGASRSETVIRPATALSPGATYRFRIRTATGTIAASWVFRAKQPLHVVTTIPGDRATEVPVRSGVEVLLDQDGIVGYEGHVKIEPAVRFRLELHTRTIALVPLQDLAPRTLYTVTVQHGIRVSGSDVTLERDVVFRFETGGPKTTDVALTLGGPVQDVAPSEVPVLRVDSTWVEGSPDIRAHVDVYRLPSLDAAIAAARTIATAPAWAQWSDAGLVATKGLAAALRFDTTLTAEQPSSATYVLRFPSKLAAGHYLVVLPRSGRDAQAVLQVTRIASFIDVSATRTVAWVNDVSTGTAVNGATISVAGGPKLGGTAADGLLVASTPASLAAAPASDRAAPVILVRTATATAFSLLGSTSFPGSDEYGGDWFASSRYWLAFATDRAVYRTTDSIGAWGTVRTRDGSKVKAVEIRVLPQSAGIDETAPPIARLAAPLDGTGTFAVSVPIAELPMGSYIVALVVDGRIVYDVWVQVEEIRKPAYAIDVRVDRHVLVAGDRFHATARAAFLDGTPVPGLELVFTDQGGNRRVTTDADGKASLTLTAILSQGVGAQVTVAPVRPEEGAIEGDAQLRIFPASVWLTGEASLTGTSLAVEGRTQVLDVAAMERAWGTSTEVDEGGAALAGSSVRIGIDRVVEHRKETGRQYDWIAKQTVPVYETWRTYATVASVTRTTGADGRVALTVTVPDAAAEYRITMTAKDSKGRTVSSSLWAGAATQGIALPQLRSSAGPTECCTDYAVGDPIRLEVADALPPVVPGGARFLFIAASRGIRDAVVRSDGRLERAFAATDVPNVTIMGVEFTGRAVVAVGPYTASVDESTRRLKVTLTTDASTYRPGSDVRLSVRTVGPDGRPRSASVVLQAVDEKLYLMGGAQVVDPLWELYRDVPSGVLWSGSTLALPSPFGSDTTGGAGDTRARSEFKDTVLFRRVTTDSSGRATVTFKVSDDLTSWRVSAAAVDARLDAGSATTLVSVGLPFFVEATIAPEFVAADRPVLRLRAYGSSIKAGQAVRFTVAAPTLGLAPTTVNGVAFTVSRLALPALSVGAHSLDISASTVGRSPALADRLVRTIRVVGSRFAEATTSFQVLDAAFVATGGDGLTTYAIADAGRGGLLAILDRLAWTEGARVDQVLPAAVARDLLIAEFGRDPADLPSPAFQAEPYQKEHGVALFPYGSGDLALTAQVAMAAPERFDRDWLRANVRASYGDPESTMTRERGVIALAALAAMGEPVLGELGPFASSPDLTVRERLYLGLAYAYLGDDTDARAVERSLLTAFGRASGPWVRLEGTPDKDEMIEATGLLAILAAALGDPIADRAQAYVEANPPRTTLLGLQEIAFARSSLDRLSSQPARFAYTVGGIRSTVELGPGEQKVLTLTAAQRATLRLERLSGEIGVTMSWVAAAKPGDRQADPGVRITRTVTPGTSIGEAQVVRVRIGVTFSGTASTGCYEIVDRVPSGLAPLEGTYDAGVVGPYAVAGQLVHFCMSTDMQSRTVGYSARVVSPGTYAWEPATVTSSVASDRVSLTGATTLTIK